MRKSKPLVDDEGEVRELLVEDLRKFRPLPEVVTPALAEKLGVSTSRTPSPDEAGLLSRKQGEARRIASEHYPFRCCVVCGLQLLASLTVAYLDHKPGNNDPDNLAYLCGTHHWMYDAGLYPIDAVKRLREHWQKTKGKPDHKGRMKDAGIEGALTRMKSAAARRAGQTRRQFTG